MLKENKIQSEKHQNDGIDSRDNCATSVNYMVRTSNLGQVYLHYYEILSVYSTPLYIPN